MFYIQRKWTISIVYWTGRDWSPAVKDAKFFDTRGEAQDEIETAGINVACRIRKF